MPECANAILGASMPPFEILRPPDQVSALLERGAISLGPSVEGRFAAGGVELDAIPGEGLLALRLRTNAPILFLRLRWQERIPEGLRYLGDTWGLAYEPLEWRCLAPERALPWYFLSYDGQHTHAVGVKTGASAFCHWHVDPFGVTLWLDVRNGAGPVHPGDRELPLAEVVVRPGKVWELPFQAARRFATLLDNDRLLPEQPVYGWNVAHGARLGPQALLEQAQLVADLSENTVNRPFFVLGEGWQQGAPVRGTVGMHPAPELGDPGALAHEIADRDCRPGLWLRPLLSAEADHAAWALPAQRFTSAPIGRVLDPTHPATIEIMRRDLARALDWGFELIRVDLTTTDLLGAWSPYPSHSTEEGWRFRDRSLTTAEVLRNLYACLHDAIADGALLAASNTLGHLTAGHVHLQHISLGAGREPRVHPHIAGINALGFRGFHHGALYAAESDAVSLHPRFPWTLAEQWLRLLAASGTPCFVEAGQDPLSDAQLRALRSAFSQASRQLTLAEPLDWLATTGPGRWKLGNETVSFDWYSAAYDPLA